MTTDRTAELRQLRCVSEPVSWLRLEQHRLGDLSPSDASAVQAHLAACPACAACAAEASEPVTLARPKVMEREVLGSGPRTRAASWLRRWRAGLSAGVLSGAVVAAAFVLMTRSTPLPGSSPGAVELSSREPVPGSKGGDIAIELVRERGGEIVHRARTFRAEDRWKVLVTCPAERALFWDVVVVDDGAQPMLPLSPTERLTCGNHVALPGAFQLSGVGAKRLCVLFSDRPLDRRRLASTAWMGIDRDFTAGQAVCAALRPEGAATESDPEPGVGKGVGKDE